VVFYTPDRLCIELKSLKTYLVVLPGGGPLLRAGHQPDPGRLVRACRPREMTVIGRFNVRGGIGTTVVARHPDDRRLRAAGGPRSA